MQTPKYNCGGWHTGTCRNDIFVTQTRYVSRYRNTVPGSLLSIKQADTTHFCARPQKKEGELSVQQLRRSQANPKTVGQTMRSKQSRVRLGKQNKVQRNAILLSPRT